MAYDANYWNSGAFMDTPQVNNYQQQFNQQPVGPQINDTNNGLMQAASPEYDPNVWNNQGNPEFVQGEAMIGSDAGLSGYNPEVFNNQGNPQFVEGNELIGSDAGLSGYDANVFNNQGNPQFMQGNKMIGSGVNLFDNRHGETDLSSWNNQNNPAFVEGNELIGTGTSLFENPHGQTDLSSWGFNNPYMQGAGSYTPPVTNTPPGDATGVVTGNNQTENVQTPSLGLFGKEGGFGSGQGWFSRIGEGGEGFMGKFGTGEGKIAKAFGGGDTTEDATDLSAIGEEEEEADEMGFGGKLFSGLASGLQNMGSYQYGMFG